MANLLPFILKEEQELIKQDTVGRNISVVLDGTTRLGETIIILIRYAAND